MNLKAYLLEVFEPTILYSMGCALVGAAAAWYLGHLRIYLAVAVVIGVMCSQISVNLFDDYFDYKSGLDKAALHTKFSGGSELVVKHIVKPNHVLMIAIAALIVGLALGAYAIIATGFYVVLTLFIAIGAVTVVLYAKSFVKVSYLAEHLTMLNFILIGFGSFIVISGSLANVWIIAPALIAAGIIPGLALYTNEVPDRFVDAKFGRKSTVVLLNDGYKIAAYYLIMQSIIYMLILIGIIAGALPWTLILTLLVVPLIYCTFRGMWNYDNVNDYIPSMANNVIAGLGFLALMILAFLI